MQGCNYVLTANKKCLTSSQLLFNQNVSQLADVLKKIYMYNCPKFLNLDLLQNYSLQKAIGFEKPSPIFLKNIYILSRGYSKHVKLSKVK